MLTPTAWSADGFVRPSAVPEGWELTGEPETFVADNLYEHIDGAAPAYLRYGFRLLTVQPVRMVDDPTVEIEVEVYEFGSHLDAFGIYSNERAPNLKYLRLGAEGYFADPACRFYKGNYYVKLNGSRKNDEVHATEERLAAAVAASLRGAVKPPPLLNAIPQANVVPGSVRYEGSDLMAHDFLGAGFTADYDLGGEKASKLFFSVKASRGDAREAYFRLLAFLRQGGEVGERVRLAHGRGHMTTHPFYGPSLICRSDDVVCGVLRAGREEEAAALVNALLSRLAKVEGH